MKTVLSVWAVILCLGTAVASAPGVTALGWKGVESVKATISETGYGADKAYKVVRQGSSIRVDGTYAVYGAFAKSPHVELVSDSGSYLYIPSMSAALRLAGPLSTDRAEVTYSVKFEKDILELPRDVLERELKRPAKVEGTEKVAGRYCYVLTTADATSNVRKQKQWIDKAYGLALKTQDIEADKVVFERVVKDISVNAAVAASQFAVPSGVVVVNGLVSMQAFENLRNLGDEAGYATEVGGLVKGLTKYKPGFQWAELIVPPQGFGHADTSYRPLTALEIAMVRDRAANDAANALANLPPGTRVIRDRNGNLVTITGGGRGRRGGPPGSSSDVTVTVQGGDNTGSSNTGGPGGGRGRGRRNGGPGGAAGNGTVSAPISALNPPSASELREGIFTSEFIDPSTGNTFVFLEAKELDPTAMIAQKAPLGKGEKVTLFGAEGMLYHADKPFERDVLAWKKDSYFVISATGLPRDQLLKAANSLRAAK